MPSTIIIDDTITVVAVVAHVEREGSSLALGRGVGRTSLALWAPRTAIGAARPAPDIGGHQRGPSLFDAFVSQATVKAQTLSLPSKKARRKMRGLVAFLAKQQRSVRRLSTSDDECPKICAVSHHCGFLYT